MRSAALVLVRRLAVSAAAIAVLAGAGTAAAGTTALGCIGTTSTPFRAWLDPAGYVLAPGGAFEPGMPAWSLTGGARVVPGNEPFRVRARGDAYSLSIPPGGSAVSPPFCVGVLYPTLRFFATGGSLTSPLRVDIIYPTVLGTISHPVGLILPRPAWGPTLQQLVVANLTGLTSLRGLTSNVQLRLTPLGRTGWTVDDVYVDPWKIT
jgi:hypothetical protein